MPSSVKADQVYCPPLEAFTYEIVNQSNVPVQLQSLSINFYGQVMLNRVTVAGDEIMNGHALGQVVEIVPAIVVMVQPGVSTASFEFEGAYPDMCYTVYWVHPKLLYKYIFPFIVEEADYDFSDSPGYPAP
jgi:hypothetical protein